MAFSQVSGGAAADLGLLSRFSQHVDGMVKICVFDLEPGIC